MLRETALAWALIQLTASALPLIRTTASGLAGSGHGFNQCFFRLGKVDAGAIATEESGSVTGICSPFKRAG